MIFKDSKRDPIDFAISMYYWFTTTFYDLNWAVFKVAYVAYLQLQICYQGELKKNSVKDAISLVYHQKVFRALGLEFLLI